MGDPVKLSKRVKAFMLRVNEVIEPHATIKYGEQYNPNLDYYELIITNEREGYLDMRSYPEITIQVHDISKAYYDDRAMTVMIKGDGKKP